MKRKVIQILFLLSFLFFTDYSFYHLKVHFGSGWIIYVIDYLLKSILIFILFESILYKTLFDFKSNKYSLSFLIVIPLLASLHISHRLIAIDKLYFLSKNITLKSSDNLWRFDKLLGHRAVPNSKGAYLYYIGDTIKGEVPVLFDSLGYRTVNHSLKIISDNTDLYLGCSFTFGDYVEAQNTYPFLTSKMLSHNYLNAGASAYGIAQMYQIAKMLIPKNKFTYVFIQLSPWLSERGMQLNGPTYYGYRPCPYFSQNKNTFYWNPPAYETIYFEASKNNWRETKSSYFEKIKFLFTDGYKTELIDYYSCQLAKLKVKIGLIPKPTKNKKSLELYFYDELIEMCHKHSVIPVVLKLRYENNECNELVNHLSKKSVVIDLDYSLDSLANKTGIPFQNLFGIYHVQRNDSIWYDGHPNKLAHKLYSEKIYKLLTNRNN